MIFIIQLCSRIIYCINKYKYKHFLTTCSIALMFFTKSCTWMYLYQTVQVVKWYTQVSWLNYYKKNCIQQGFVLVIIHKYITLIHFIYFFYIFFIITDIKSSPKINNAKTCTNGCMDRPVNKLGLSQNFKHTWHV